MAPGGGKDSTVEQRKKVGCGTEKANKIAAESEIAQLLDRSLKWINQWWAKEKQPGSNLLREQKMVWSENETDSCRQALDPSFHEGQS